MTIILRANIVKNKEPKNRASLGLDNSLRPEFQSRTYKNENTNFRKFMRFDKT